MKQYIFLISLFLLLPLSGYAANPELEWPIRVDQPWEQMDSFFGPRLQGCSDVNECYDFHRGLDLDGEIGDGIYAAADGEVYGVYTVDDEDSPYSGGGNVVILQHDVEQSFRFQKQQHTRFYTFYYHMDSLETELEPGDTVEVGDQLGTLGETGAASSPHLHFEVRVGEICSLSSSCNDSGFDPHVNPLRYLEYPETDVVEEIDIYRKKKAVRVDLSLPIEEYDLNAVYVYALNKNKKHVRRKRINFNTRLHINAADREALDQNLYRRVKIFPHPVKESTGQHGVEIAFQKMLSKKVKYIRVVVKDAHGKTIKTKTVKKSNL